MWDSVFFAEGCFWLLLCLEHWGGREGGRERGREQGRERGREGGRGGRESTTIIIIAERKGIKEGMARENERQVFTHSGSFLQSFGQYGSGPGELNRPVGILVHNEYVYITEVASLCISVFTTSGEFSTSFAVGEFWKCTLCYISHNNNYLFTLQGEQSNLGVL